LSCGSKIATVIAEALKTWSHIKNKSAKLTQNTPIVFVVNSMVMTTFLGAGYSTWRADTANTVFGQFKSHNSGDGGFGRLQNLVEILCPPTSSPSLIKTGWKLFDLESGNHNFGQFKGHNSGVPGRIWQVIELGRDIMHTNIFTKFDKDQMKTPT